MPNPTRKIVTRDELNKILTTEIRQVEDLEDATLHAGQRLAARDATGCNWSHSFKFNPGSKGSVAYGMPFAQGIVQAARARHNLRD